MDLYEKPFYAVRDLATRLGIPAPTSYNKDKLIDLIEKRKVEIENNEKTPERSNLGRPRLNHTYIGIRKDENGKLAFYDAAQPVTEKVVPDEPKVIIQKRPAAIKDEPTRKALMQVKDLVQSLYIALDKVLERD